jgi:integrase
MSIALKNMGYDGDTHTAHGFRAAAHAVPKLDVHLLFSRTGGKLTKSTVNRLFERLGRELNLPVPLCPHMLRHTACTELVRTNGLVTVARFAGHASIHSTVRYVGMNPGEYEGIWKAA